MVKAVVDGKGQVRRVSIDPSFVDKEDVEMLEDLILAAVKQSQAKARDVYEKLVRMEPGDVKARTAMAEVFLAKGEEARAVAELQKAAGDLEGLGLGRESLIVHRRVLSLGLREVGRMRESIRAAIRLGDPEAAIAAAQSLLSRFPEENAAAEALVEALELGGREKQAEELVKK